MAVIEPGTPQDAAARAARPGPIGVALLGESLNPVRALANAAIAGGAVTLALPGAR